jgi:hypothetical protein
MRPVLGQDGSCEQIPVENLTSTTSLAPNIAPQAETAALLGAAQWYKPTDHGLCDMLPLSDFLKSVEVISACSFDDSIATGADSFNGTYLTYVVDWKGTVPCSEENQEVLREKVGPNTAFTLEFQTNYTALADLSVPAIVTTKNIGPDKGVPDEVRDYEGTNECPDGFSNVFLDDRKAVEVANNAARAYYDPSEHGLCGSKPADEFLQSVEITSACVSDSSGDYDVEFRGTIPCDADGREKVIEEVGPQVAFTFNFNATGASDGDLLSAQIISGYDNTGAPNYVFDPDSGSGSVDSRAMGVGVKQALASSLVALALMC